MKIAPQNNKEGEWEKKPTIINRPFPGEAVERHLRATGHLPTSELCDEKLTCLKAKSIIKQEVYKALSTCQQELIQEVVKKIKGSLPKVITPTVEPPPNKLSQNQIFAGGQMNMLMRVGEVLDNIISKLKGIK